MLVSDDKVFVLETQWGRNITHVIEDAIVKARDLDLVIGNYDKSLVRFEFNGTTVTVASDSNIELIYRDWSRSMADKIDKNVGPYPAEKLSAEEIAKDAEVDERNAEEAAAQRESANKREDAKRQVVSRMLDLVGPLEVTDQSEWDRITEVNSKDFYSARCVSYAVDWGRLMQFQIADGQTVAQCQEKCSHLADVDGITGFMHGAAKQMLCRLWKHGAELAKRESEAAVRAIQEERERIQREVAAKDKADAERPAREQIEDHP